MPSHRLGIDRTAPTERIDLDEHSWVDIIRNFVLQPEELHAELLESLPWKESLVWRYETYLTEPRLHAQVAAADLPAPVRQAGLHLEAAHRVRLGTPTLLRYRDGSDSVAPHRDRAMRWLDETLVAIAVLGEPRPFIIRPLGVGRDDSSSDIDLAPGTGDVVVMGGRCQADWLHGVPKVDQATDRISITWRWTSRRGRPDSSAPYQGARNFGDSGRVGPQKRPATRY